MPTQVAANWKAASRPSAAAASAAPRPARQPTARPHRAISRKLASPYSAVAAACPRGTAERVMGNDRKRSTTPRVRSRAATTIDGTMLAAVEEDLVQGGAAQADVFGGHA